MRYRIVFCVFALVGLFLFVPFIRAGEDHGKALIDKLGMSYGERTEVLAITPCENEENVQMAAMAHLTVPAVSPVRRSLWH